MGCCSNRCTATQNNGGDKGDPMKNGAELDLHRGNTELGNENNGDIEGESDKTILCGESEVMLWHYRVSTK